MAIFIAQIVLLPLAVVLAQDAPPADSATPAPAATPPAEISRATWGAAVGFAPNLSIDGYAPGMTIDRSNIDTFAAIVPEPVAILIRQYGLSLSTKDYEPYAPSEGYLAATRKNRGKAKLVEIGADTKTVGIANYEGGLPFPLPQSAREVAWNFHYAYGGDDGENEFSVYWISAKNGVERHETWKWTYIVNTKHRTDVPPMPVLDRLAKKNIAATSVTETLFPPDRKGQLALYIVYDNPTDREGWVYVPAQRRTFRFTSGNHGESWNNTDLLYEDIRGYSGRPEWMDWKIVAKTTMLAPFQTGAPHGKDAAGKIYDFENPPHFLPRLMWQLRPVYVMELTPKLASYPYSRQLLYIDAEAWYPHAKVAYDRKGQLWKVMINASNASPDPRTKPLSIATSLLVDLQEEHATAFPWLMNRANIGVDPNLFSQTTLRKKGQ